MIVFDAIIPQLFDYRKFRSDVVDNLAPTGERIAADFEERTKNWRTPPEFYVTSEETAEGLILKVTTDNEIFGYVDQGTEPHEILPVNSPVLVFNIDGETIFTTRVFHPGYAGSHISEEIAALWEDRWLEAVENAITDAIADSVFGMY